MFAVWGDIEIDFYNNRQRMMRLRRKAWNEMKTEMEVTKKKGRKADERNATWKTSPTFIT